MKNIRTDSYRGWDIRIKGEQNMCSNFSFDITPPSGKTQHVGMGGDNEARALARAREMIEMELAFAEEN
ncbi:MAG: hypothetical protein P4L42_08330 [Desulfocapsaceae bacterium]|nr:hypothetical protein [Desulfocapsaceae bacterium]